jgi:Serpin (serine protease inhibitor)
VFKGIANLKTNYVFSPFGFSSILSILSEGARGQTLKEINEVMRFSDNIDRVRKSFSDALANLQNKDPHMAPQFKTWLYVYKNNTIDDYFKNTVRDFYFVDVKDIERNFYDFDDPKSSDFIPEVEETEQPDQKDEKPVTQSTNSKDILEFESLKKSEPFDKDGSIEGFDDLKIDDIDDIKEASKFDKVVDQEKQYVEVPTIKKEIAKEKLQQKLEAENEVQSEAETDVAKTTVEVINGDKEEVQDAPEKILLPLKKFDDFEIMQAVETKSIVRKVRRNFFGS